MQAFGLHYILVFILNFRFSMLRWGRLSNFGCQSRKESWYLLWWEDILANKKACPWFTPHSAHVFWHLWGLSFFHALLQWWTVLWGISFVCVWTAFCSWPSAHPILSGEVKPTASLSDEASRKPTVGTGIRSPVTFAAYSLLALSSRVSFSGARLCFPASKCACKAEDRWKDLTRYSSGQQNKLLAKVIYLFIYLFVYLIILLLTIFWVLLDLFCTVHGLVRGWGFFFWCIAWQMEVVLFLEWGGQDY